MSSIENSSKPIHFYTLGTPNGLQVSILLEELKAADYPIDYDWQKIDIFKNTQKEPWFLKLNPNGRIPTIIDHSRGNFAVFETAAINLYLAQHYDKNYTFWFDAEKDPNNYSEMLQWIFFAHGGVSPMQDEANHYNIFAKEDVPYAKKRYLDETKRLFGVLELRLKDRDWLAGSGRGKYSLADIKTFPWVRVYPYTGLENLDEFPHLKAWIERAEARPATKSGLEQVFTV